MFFSARVEHAWIFGFLFVNIWRENRSIANGITAYTLATVEILDRRGGVFFSLLSSATLYVAFSSFLAFSFVSLVSSCSRCCWRLLRSRVEHALPRARPSPPRRARSLGFNIVEGGREGEAGTKNRCGYCYASTLPEPLALAVPSFWDFVDGGVSIFVIPGLCTILRVLRMSARLRFFLWLVFITCCFRHSWHIRMSKVYWFPIFFQSSWRYCFTHLLNITLTRISINHLHF